MDGFSKEDIDQMFENSPFHPDPLMNFAAKVLHKFHKEAEDGNDAMLSFLYSQDICAREMSIESFLQSQYLVNLAQDALLNYVCDPPDRVYLETLNTLIAAQDKSNSEKVNAQDPLAKGTRGILRDSDTCGSCPGNVQERPSSLDGRHL